MDMNDRINKFIWTKAIQTKFIQNSIVRGFIDLIGDPTFLEIMQILDIAIFGTIVVELIARPSVEILKLTCLGLVIFVILTLLVDFSCRVRMK